MSRNLKDLKNDPTRANSFKEQLWSNLVTVFENLNIKSFRALTQKLLYRPPPKKCKKIARSELEDVDANKLADLFIRYYTTEHAGQFAVGLLADINEKQLSKELEEALKEVENCTCDKKDKTTQTSPSLHSSSAAQDINPATDWESTDPAQVLNKSEKTPGRQGNPKYSHLVTITQSHKRHKRGRQDEEIEPLSKKHQTTNISFESLYCNEKPLFEETQIQISRCGSNLENPVEGTSHPQISRLHISQQEGNIKVISTTEITFAPTNIAIIPSSPSRPVSVRQDINTSPLTVRTNQPDVNKIAPRGRALPDIKLQALKKFDLQIMKEHHNGKPHIYAKLLFQHFVPYDTYKTWTQNTNFDGYRGKNALPNNLRVAILKQIWKLFQLTKKDRVEIKRTINGLLANPRTAGWPVRI
ncbi:uncharacterized protein LOC108703891 [Xenopus laevis]|uniref:Uncharacterized protein LOC108703891 n=1 Tax=Xenopus laevis TaxID=8355 RepID=A0A8J0U645_XENLA|nr:uncharacterized protein LOC108703891 [Xenopus laevis]OCT59060.1 hypothetical protein XELAEV_18001546mg [Xenopus laevis]